MKSCSNKSIGTEFEDNFCQWLAKRGYWVHFLAPDKRGAQPFDVIAAKDGKTLVVDCKTSSRPIFTLSRMEENQILAFGRWVRCGNSTPYVAVKYADNLYMINYDKLQKAGKVDLRKEKKCEDWTNAD